MTDWTYWTVHLPPRSSATSPETVLRLGTGQPRCSAEVLTRTGAWQHSDLLDEVFTGAAYEVLTPVPAPTARALVLTWHLTGDLACLPDDLAAPT